MDKILIIGNGVYIPIDKSFDEMTLETKYIHCSISGAALDAKQYTRREIEARVSDPSRIKECEGFKNLHKIWRSH